VTAASCSSEWALKIALDVKGGKAAAPSHVMRRPLRPLDRHFVDRDPEQPVEGQRPRHVADDDVALLERERRIELQHGHARLCIPRFRINDSHSMVVEGDSEFEIDGHVHRSRAVGFGPWLVVDNPVVVE